MLSRLMLYLHVMPTGNFNDYCYTYNYYYWLIHYISLFFYHTYCLIHDRLTDRLSDTKLRALAHVLREYREIRTCVAASSSTITSIYSESCECGCTQ